MRGSERRSSWVMSDRRGRARISKAEIELSSDADEGEVYPALWIEIAVIKTLQQHAQSSLTPLAAKALILPQQDGAPGILKGAERLVEVEELLNVAAELGHHLPLAFFCELLFFQEAIQTCPKELFHKPVGLTGALHPRADRLLPAGGDIDHLALPTHSNGELQGEMPVSPGALASLLAAGAGHGLQCTAQKRLTMRSAEPGGTEPLSPRRECGCDGAWSHPFIF